ncbi:hypothetical protein BURKHO8Y_150073 [Burkholderia sp. 8Y]|nr:hypothetical protein BURKHO8Y_150073 [Burkholderia sp. 8Y]
MGVEAIGVFSCRESGAWVKGVPDRFVSVKSSVKPFPVGGTVLSTCRFVFGGAASVQEGDSPNQQGMVEL